MDNLREKLIDLASDQADFLPWDIIENIADHLIANGVTVQRWIPVSERLPEENKQVLVCLSSKVTVVAYLRENIWYVAWNRAVLNNITRWTPLPEPPKEEK